MDKIQAVYDALGTVAIGFLIYMALGKAKKETSDMANKETNPTKKVILQDSSVVFSTLESLAKVYVAGLDNSSAPNVEKQAAATQKLQAFVNSKGLNVSVPYLRNLVDSQVNDLRAKQGMAQQSSNAGQSVTVHEIPGEGGVNNG